MSTIDELPPLRTVIAEHDLVPRKQLGQNFLLDLNLTSKIARQAAPLEDCIVVEVGPGPGGLTRALLANGASRVVAAEKDPRCVPVLEDIAKRYPGRLEVRQMDALDLDVESIAEDRTLKIVANLPYNVGTQLLVNWLSVEAWPPRWQSLTLMFQKEVAERIVALPSSSHYGRLAVLAGCRTKARILFDIPRQAFTPPPKVTSAVVQLTPRDAPLPVSLAALEKVTLTAFGQRRKMLRQSLKPLGGEALLNAVGIDPQRRAETLSIEEFVAIANACKL
ncbi:dimethyladenosine transferase (16S rRNA dimethylase) protein [Fulvimarina pelagi HTCC2506]|uniref:Ribosomal RNA small subunit methyltransferase A n=1 Tax=Fulvimarina pelagi HTCC2506 TaxID=314231 RepID=Q0G6M5_9HYPH|nr:16S rRNA (adenine(1518)-N(6)/adenine(1519)-N(6))-dimethyltransferase RsmA [Fulvimarina pelagi]EAU42689.1 dimethyladenosine transferase (16S rRNA dimethylase) protein [Fulvimarina pelagi HTCC2506]